MKGADLEKAGAATAGREAGAGILGEEDEVYHGRVVSFEAVVWQGGVMVKAEMLRF